MNDGGEDFALVAFFDEAGDIHTMRIALDACPVARARGWLVFDDFERQMLADVPVQSNPRRQADGFSGEEGGD